MDTIRICNQCQKPLPPNAPEGLCPECLAKAAFGSEPPNPGTRVPPDVAQLAAQLPQLEIIELLGMGGMGMVYKARQPRLDRLVALKILPVASMPDVSFAERFEREARALARLNHPGIVTLHDFGQTGEYYYFIMEYVDGMNLRQLIQAKTMDPRQALELVMQICTALQFAHDEKIVHRDIKPENILITKKGQVKIADFGLAKLMGTAPDTNLTASQTMMGTLNYMAPEQRENTKEVDHRADIYSLGVVFYEMLTGEVPMGRFDAPSKKVQIDVRLDEVVLHAMEREPARRYQHVSEVKTGVETITSSAPKPAAPEGAPPSAPTTPIRVRARIVEMMIFGIIAFIAIIIIIQGIGPATQLWKRTPNTVKSGKTAISFPIAPRWTNSLGMVFVPVMGTSSAFSIWDTRVQDFSAFADETGYQTQWSWSWRHASGANGGGHWIWRWNNQELAPGPLYPASGLSWNNAHAFCRWLTEKEHKSGLLKAELAYRLPTEEEWSVIFGGAQYPWGNQWPPPSMTGNFAGLEATDKSWPSEWPTILGYRDPYVRSSPVGSFPSNWCGLYDISGNVWQWSEDLHGTNHSNGVLRGGAWNSGTTGELQSSHRDTAEIGDGYETHGFRCVISRISTSEPGAAHEVTLKFVSVDSESDSPEKRGANAVDRNPNTFWETQWHAEHPHEIVIELVPPASIKGFTYLPRQDDDNGAIKDYEFYVSDDGKNFGQPVSKGAFESDRGRKTALFQSVKCRFFKLKALSEIGGGSATSAAEIGVLQSADDAP